MSVCMCIIKIHPKYSVLLIILVINYDYNLTEKLCFTIHFILCNILLTPREVVQTVNRKVKRRFTSQRGFAMQMSRARGSLCAEFSNDKSRLPRRSSPGL